MAWQDRLIGARYTGAQSATSMSFDYENVSQTIEKKTTGYNFPDADGTLVQDLGNTGRRYPLRVFFWGDDHDLQANTFDGLLLEKGAGTLDHPLYGTVRVVPFGAIKRRDDLKTAANQTIIEVTFWETIEFAYPTPQADPAALLTAAVQAHLEVSAEAFEGAVSVDTAFEAAKLESDSLALIDLTRIALSDIADQQEDTRKQFDAIFTSINTGIDVLVRDPLTLAFQAGQLVHAPARALTSITARLKAYKDLSQTVIDGGEKGANTFHISDVFVSGSVAASALSTVNNQFSTKTGALEAADEVLSQLADVVVWREANFATLSQIDTGEAYQKLQEVVALTVGFLVGISFTLKQERTIVLDRSRTIIDLAAELYGEVDGQLDFLIASNNLSGSEILEVPRGREIAYYV